MRKTYEATKKAISSVFSTAAEDLGADLREINSKIIVPAVKLGENRLVSAFAVGKVGFVAGGIVGGAHGIVLGAAAGALIGAVGGPTTAEWLGKKLKPDVELPEAANENTLVADTPAPKPRDPSSGPR